MTTNTTIKKPVKEPKAKAKIERTHVLELRVRNFKAIREVCITPDGECLAVKGDTGQGKTSILDAIEATLRGIDPDLVHHEAGSAELELKLDKIKVKRVQPKEGKETLIVTGPNGEPIEKGSGLLKALCGPNVFRPIQWVERGGGEKRGQTERLRMQRAQLLEALPVELEADDVRRAVKALGPEATDAMRQMNLDGVNWDAAPFAVCEALEKVVYETRKLHNKDVERLERELANTPAPQHKAVAESVEELSADFERAQEAYYSAKNNSGKQEQQRRLYKNLQEEIEQMEADYPSCAKLELREEAEEKLGELRKDEMRVEVQISELREALEKAIAERDAIEKRIRRGEVLISQMDKYAAKKADLAELETALEVGEDVVDVEQLRREMEELKGDLVNKRQQEAHDAKARELATALAVGDIHTALIKLFRDEMPLELLRRADLPIPGLALDEEQITIHGTPLHQLGTSEQIKIGVVIAAALNPSVGFVLIDRAESLGRKDLVALGKIAQEMELQLIMTFVDADAKPGDGVVVMSGGHKV
jgi:DNA repair exonuclease SbcCD ATPase subunit